MKEQLENFPVLKSVILKALEDYCKFDHEELYRYGINEPTISHRIAHYIELHLNEYRVFNHLSIDCEYNKMKDDLKRNEKGKVFRPDITIHKRGNNYYNICYIEIKKGSIKKNAQIFTKKAEKDFRKIQNAMKPKLNYKTACFISILKNKIQFYFLTKPVKTLKDIPEFIDVCTNP